MAVVMQAAMLATAASMHNGGRATPPETGAGSSEDNAGDEPAAAVQSTGLRARAAATAAQALAEEPQATGSFKQNGLFIPHTRYLAFNQ